MKIVLFLPNLNIFEILRGKKLPQSSKYCMVWRQIQSSNKKQRKKLETISWFQLPKSLKRVWLSPSPTSGAWEYSCTSCCPANSPSRAKPRKRRRATSSTSGSSSSGSTRRSPWRLPDYSCGSSRALPGKTL